MNRVISLVTVLVIASGTAIAQEAESTIGAQLLAPFKADLQQALLEGLASGPQKAIAACRIEAPKIAATLSRDGVRVGRASQRLRNPSNVAPQWVVPILEAWANNASDRAARTVALDADRSGYAEPILVQPLCLTCHGTDIAPDVAERLEALYPDDRAVGYEVGELRGAFWVEFPQRD